MATTRTGGFGIGFRRSRSDWQRDLDGLIAWAGENGFDGMDVASPDDAAGVDAAGLRIGTADLPQWQDMLSADKGKRDAAVTAQTAFIKSCGSRVRSFFIVMLPENPALSRKDNFGYALESYGQVVDALAASKSRLAIEGWPGPGALCCTPETYRAFIEALDSPGVGLCYDPSHLIRMGIDPILFLHEFAEHVSHVHGKDTELKPEALYEFGHEQPPTFGESVPFGGTHWRYTIPGHGQMRWSEGLHILENAGYEGMVSVELEDANFNGSEDGEKQGLILARRYLEGC